MLCQCHMLIWKNSTRFSNLGAARQALQKMCNIFCTRPFNNPLLVFIMVLSFFFNVHSQDTPENAPEMPQTIRPSKGIVIAVLSIMFAISFLLLAYVKFCRISPLELLNRDARLINSQGLTSSGSRFSGIDKQVIEALPFFKFSSLKGSKEGLECAVCLSKFEDIEILRLLPKCKHAFHISCIDKWLESHSSCPLCRCRVDPADIKSFTSSISSRFLRVPSNLTEDPNLQVFVEREQSSQGSSGRFWGRKEEPVIGEEGRNGRYWKLLRKLNHKIVISDVATRSRWSDLNSSDLLSLNSEMLNDASSRRFSHLEERLCRSSSLPSEENSFTLLNPGEKRSMSEIANVARFADIGIRESGGSSGNNGREERLRRVWLPIVQRTVQWFARRETSLRELEQHKPLTSNV